MKTVVLNKQIHKRENFDCEEPELVTYIKTRANKEQSDGICACFVATDDNEEIIGYYTLSSGSIPREDIPEKYQKKVPRGYGVPVIILGRVARHTNQKGTPTGRFLLMDALQKIFNNSKEVGALAVILDPKNPVVEGIYANYGFVKIESGKMFLPIKVIAQIPGIES